MKFILVLLLVCAVTAQKLWTYNENELAAPSRWGEIHTNGDLSFPKCSNGAEQSPINIEQAEVDPSSAILQLSWIESNNYTVVNDGEDITVIFHDVVSKLAHPSGSQYEFKYAQIHAPSAHTVGGGARDGELILVHESDNVDDKIRRVVVSVSLVGSYGHHEHMNTLINAIPQYSGTSISTENLQSVSLKSLVPADLDVLVYKGSMMQPPCTEGAEYYVFRHPVTISFLQLQAIKDKRGQNKGIPNKRSSQVTGSRRPLRTLNSRLLVSLDSVGEVESMTTEDIFALCAVSIAGISALTSIVALLISCCTERHEDMQIM